MTFAEHILPPHSQEAMNMSANPEIETEVDRILARIDSLRIKAPKHLLKAQYEAIARWLQAANDNTAPIALAA